MYTRILVPLENSEADETILYHVGELARLHHAHIVFAHVAVGFVARYQDALDLQDSEEIRRARAYLESVKKRFEVDGFDVEVVLETGDPATRLVGLAEAGACDLIAMATHRHGIFQDVLRGSVAHAVRHRTRIPVLMVPSR
ncbi:MAG: universal stress protein [Candidatus Eisenbacteria bacterium]